MIRYLLKLVLSLGLFLCLIGSGEIRLQAFQQLGAHRLYVLLPGYAERNENFVLVSWLRERPHRVAQTYAFCRSPAS